MLQHKHFLLFFAVVGLGSADTLDFRMFNAAEYTQTAAGTAFQGYSYEMDDITAGSTALNSATVTYPGAGSPATLTQSPTDPTFFNEYFGPYASLANLHSALPFGNYTTTVTNGTTTLNATINYAADYFEPTVPALSAASFGAVQDWNPNQALTINFNAFTPNATTTGEVGTYVTIFGPNSTPFSTFVAPNVTSVTIPADTLAGGTNYSLQISQGGRVVVPQNAQGITTEFGFNNDTTIDFTTVPEPAELALAGLALCAFSAKILKKRG